MTFVADDFTAWLLGFLADAGRKRMVELLLGSEQERALRRVAGVVVHRTAEELCLADEVRATQLAMVIDQVFAVPVPSAPLERHGTLLEAVQDGIIRQLAPLDDADLTGVGVSSAGVLGVSAAALAETLTAQFLQEIIVRGARGGPLAPLASQLNHDVTHLQGQRVEGMLARIGAEVLESLAQLHGRITGAVPGAGSPAGQLVSQMSDPFALEVHRPFEIPVWPGNAELPQLPPYVLREHDERLWAVVALAESGRSTIGMLVGGSSTGKTRACWEAVRRLPDGWRLWHPIFPERAEALLDGLPSIGPRTVVWLNEAQFYLLTADAAVGERVAAGLRDLLRDPQRGPVLVLGTIWPQYWQILISPPVAGGSDPHAQARLLLAGTGINVPDSFTGSALAALAAATASDPRLAEAYAASEDGQVTQFLAGVPALLERYTTAPPTAKGIIHAAMDARRLGHGPVLSRALLETAADGYLTDEQWDQAGEDWLEAALGYTSAPCNGVRGPVAPIRSRPSPRTTASTGPGRAEGKPRSAGFRLADYLEQVGQRDRADQMPPAAFWDALLIDGDTAGLPDYIGHADRRGLHRYAALLRTRAVAVGHARPAERLLKQILVTDPWNARRASRWIAAHVGLTDPEALHSLLGLFVDIGAGDAAAVLLARDPVPHVELGRLEYAADLIYTLFRVGARNAALALTERVADSADHITAWIAGSVLTRLGWGYMWQSLHMSGESPVPAIYDDNSEPGEICDAFLSIGRDLIAKFIRDADLRSPSEVCGLLESLKELGVEDAAAVLLEHGLISRCRFDSDTPAYDLGSLLERLEPDHASALLLRAVSEIDLNRATDLPELVELVDRHPEKEQLTAALLARNPADHVDLTNSEQVGRILWLLYRTGAIDDVIALASSAVEQADIANPSHVAKLLKTLASVSADDAVTALLARDPATHADITDAGGTADLLAALQEAKAEGAVTDLMARDPAVHADLTDARGVASLLRSLATAGNATAVTVMLARNPATHVDLGAPYWNGPAIQELVKTLNEFGDQQASATLVKRAADGGMSGPFDGWFAMAREIGLTEFNGYPNSREPDGTKADELGWYDLGWCIIPVSRSGMAQLEVRGVSMEASPSAVVLLRTCKRDLSLSIPAEIVDALAVASIIPGPGDGGTTHDLICEVLRVCDTELLGVHILKSDNGTFTSELIFSTGQSVSARPADAIAIAIRIDAAIFADARILEPVGLTSPTDADDDGWSQEKAFRFPKVSGAIPAQDATVSRNRQSTSNLLLRRMHFTGIQIDTSSDTVVALLKEQSLGKLLPIAVKAADALSMSYAQVNAGARPAQAPVIHETFRRILEMLGIQLASACITALGNGSLSSELNFSDGRTVAATECDAIEAALLAKADIFTTVEVLDKHGIAPPKEDPGEASQD